MSDQGRQSSINMAVQQQKYAPDAGWLTRVTMARFYRALGALLVLAPVETVLDAGCGEGEIITRMLASRDYRRIYGIDLDSQRLRLVRHQHQRFPLAQANLEALPLPDNAVDLVLALEVLEHVGQPDRALRELWRVTRRYALLSVPNEPFWRIANMMRGAYWSRWGNTPEHINHWSVWGFRRFVSPYFKVLAVKMPVAWTMLLAEKRDSPRA